MVECKPRKKTCRKPRRCVPVCQPKRKKRTSRKPTFHRGGGSATTIKVGVMASVSEAPFPVFRPMAPPTFTPSTTTSATQTQTASPPIRDVAGTINDRFNRYIRQHLGPAPIQDDSAMEQEILFRPESVVSSPRSGISNWSPTYQSPIARRRGMGPEEFIEYRPTPPITPKQTPSTQDTPSTASPARPRRIRPNRATLEPSQGTIDDEFLASMY
jgi:hypothetical protein